MQYSTFCLHSIEQNFYFVQSMVWFERLLPFQMCHAVHEISDEYADHIQDQIIDIAAAAQRDKLQQLHADDRNNADQQRFPARTDRQKWFSAAEG